MSLCESVFRTSSVRVLAGSPHVVLHRPDGSAAKPRRRNSVRTSVTAATALRVMTSSPWVLNVGRHSSPARGERPLAFECDTSDSNAPNTAAWGDRPRWWASCARRETWHRLRANHDQRSSGVVCRRAQQARPTPIHPATLTTARRIRPRSSLGPQGRRAFELLECGSFSPSNALAGNRRSRVRCWSPLCRRAVVVPVTVMAMAASARPPA
jgi:hypothetical protein